MVVEPATEQSNAEQRLISERRPGARSSSTRESLIVETLTWCAELFGTPRVRFVRPLEPDGWIVHTLQRGGIVSHHADYAEVAMAYLVGLGRQPFAAARPRIARPDGSDVRPIALTSYLGIPVLCQDRLVGIVECAGDVKRRAEAALPVARERLAHVGQRLLFDSMLDHRQPLTAETTCVLAISFCCDQVTLTQDDLRFLGAVRDRMTISDIAAAAGLDTARAIAIVGSLIERGVLEAISP